MIKEHTWTFANIFKLEVIQGTERMLALDSSSAVDLLGWKTLPVGTEANMHRKTKTRDVFNTQSLHTCLHHRFKITLKLIRLTLCHKSAISLLSWRQKSGVVAGG